MAFRIRTNENALGVLNNLTNVNSYYSTSVNRLSTGMRINNAGDDPADFIGSEDMRKDIASMDTELRTLADNTNYIKTAEGALDEVSKLLRDARSIALQSINEPTMTATQRAANNQQIQSISESISRIANSASFGSNRILNGSSGIFGQSTALYSMEDVSFSGQFGGYAISTSSTFSVSVTTAAARASTSAKTYGLASVVGAGSFAINGVNFAVSPTDTAQDVWARINQVTSLTGVYVNYCTSSGGGDFASLIATEYGSKNRIEITDPGQLLINGATNYSGGGTDALGEVTVLYDGTNAATVSFARGEGTTLRDNYGNVINLTSKGAETTGQTYNGRIVTGTLGAKFQVGIRSGDMTSVNVGNFQSSQLGRGVESTHNLTSITVISGDDAATALNVIDKAIEDVSTGRGRLGNFQKNILESSMRSLGVARENLKISESAIRDTDMAAEATEFSKWQIMQQASLSVLAQTQVGPQAVLKLLS